MSDDTSEETGTTSDERAALEQVEPTGSSTARTRARHHLDDAEHWVKVYMELLEFKRSVLATTETACRHDGG